MILVTLGTQDKEFTRLLKAIDREIEKGVITDKVVVQAGCTKYESKNMEMFDLIPANEFDEYIKKADLIITHGGAGSILTAVKNNKKIIAAARLAKYKEHTNDHQKQIIEEFSKQGYILELKDFNKLGKLIQKSKSFKPKKFTSNTKNMIKLVSDYIEETDNVSWYNKYREGLVYLFFGGCTTLINILTFFICRQLKIGISVSNVIAWTVAVIFAFITNKLFVFDSKNMSKKVVVRETIGFFIARVISLGIDMGIIHLMINVMKIHELISKVVSNIVVIIVNYIFSKVFIFKKEKKG
jgi:UDP-N-acetylglucosamine transferase subunit ALG13/putative flippase GtrA